MVVKNYSTFVAGVCVFLNWPRLARGGLAAALRGNPAMAHPLCIFREKRFPTDRGPLPPGALFSLASLVLFGGCAVHRVNLAPLPALGADPAANSTAGTEIAIRPASSWWMDFQSPQLHALMTAALEKNFEVVAAEERLNQALALYRRAGGALWPQANIVASYDSEVAGVGRALREDAWQAGLDGGWEIDFFKRLGSARLARKADVQTRENLREVVRLALTVSVAESYFGILEQRQLLALLAKQQQTSRDLLRIIERRYEQGLISRLDVLQQQAQVAEVDSQIPTAESQLQDLQNQLGALLSAMPGSHDLVAVGVQATFPPLPELARIERPDALLQLRPDLRAARTDLISADAETARALAERLPRLVFSAQALIIGGRGPEENLVTVSADLLQPLIDWGQRRSEWVRTQAVYRERLANFSQAYLRAVWDLQALTQSEAKQKELLARLEERKRLLDATLGLATNRYSSGLTDYLPVLTAMQQLYAVEQRLIREQRRLVSLRIALHRALGGPVLPASVGEVGNNSAAVASPTVPVGR